MDVIIFLLGLAALVVGLVLVVRGKLPALQLMKRSHGGFLILASRTEPRLAPRCFNPAPKLFVYSTQWLIGELPENDIVRGMERIVNMNEAGRITLPAEARRRLGLEGPAEFEIEVQEEEEALILRPAVVLRRQDAWAYTSEHRKLLKRAHADSRADRVKKLSESELRKLAEVEN